MNYILLLSEKEDWRREDAYKAAEAVLQQHSLRYLHLKPHIFLFHYPGDLQSASDLFPVSVVKHDFVLVIPIGDRSGGRVGLDLAAELEKFFHPVVEPGAGANAG